MSKSVISESDLKEMAWMFEGEEDLLESMLEDAEELEEMLACME